MSMSLINLLKSDSDFQRRLAKRIDEVKEDKGKILSCAENYGNKYKKEVLEGEALRRNLLTEGGKTGMSEEEVLVGYGKFVPALRTPILNMLYFLLRESENDEHMGTKRHDKATKLNDYLKSKYKTEDEINEHDPELLAALDEIYQESKNHSYRDRINEEIEIESHQVNEVDVPRLKDLEDISEYLYGRASLEQFNKIKKLKALSKSPNQEEAFLAYRKALELCEACGLDFDKIPCYVK